MSASTVADLRSIAARCARLGLRVAAVPGWEQRGRGPLRPTHLVCHHTGSARDVDRILRDGRSDLAGPLCNLALHADETVVLVAAGRANHAGAGKVGNEHSIGIEATGPPFTNYNAYVKLAAAVRAHYGWGRDRVLGHKETCLPAGRKIDPAFDMPRFRAQVEQLLAAAARKPAKPPAITAIAAIPKEEPMAPLLIRAKGQTAVWAVIGGALSWVPSRAILDRMKALTRQDPIIHEVDPGDPLLKLPKIGPAPGG